MLRVRGLLTRVRKVEDARKPPKSRFDLMFGGFEVFESKVRSEIEAGALDRDFPLPHLERWYREGLV